MPQNTVTEVARFLTVPGSEGGFQVPVDPEAGVGDLHLQNLHCPGIAPNMPAVLFFRTVNTGSQDFSVRINATRLTQQRLTGAAPHSWHEVVPGGVLKEKGNELTLAVDSEGGVVRFSDIVILYTSRAVEVLRPVVLEQANP